jgi:hypothetical protein
MNIDLTTIINAIIALLAAIVTYRVIPWIKAKTTNEQQAYIRALVKAGVYAAEQIYQADGMGAKKMEYVKKWLHMHGYDIDVTEIEAAVSEYINRPVDGVVYAEVPIDPPEE